MTYHWHSSVELIRVLEGALTLTLDNRTHLLKAGDIAVVNSETVHGATPNRCVYECVVFSPAFLKSGNAACDDFIDALLSHTITLDERPSPALAPHFHAFFDELAKPTVSPFFVLGNALRLFGAMRDHSAFTSTIPPSSSQKQQLQTALSFIRKNYAKNLTLQDMANAVGFSEKYFCRFFKEATNTTPVKYLVAYRIERAAAKLLSCSESVTTVAFDCGFNDLSYFVKTFKNLVGVTPSAYKKGVQK